jgi:putative MATE family efflux protein
MWPEGNAAETDERIFMKISLSNHFTYRKLLRFTIPSIAMVVFTSIYSVVDGFFVSNFVGSQAIAAINLIFPVVIILGSIGFMIGIGGSAYIAMLMGEGKDEEAKGIFSFLVIVLVVIGIIFAAAGFILTRPISAAMGASGELLDQCVVYGHICFLGLLPLMLQYSFQSFMITAERPTIGFVVTVGSGITNMVLDALFVGLWNMGIAGAAWATITSQFLGAVVPIVVFFQKKQRLYFVKPIVDWRALKKVSTNGMSEFFTNISMSVVSIVYNLQLMNIIGEDGVAAYGVIMYVAFVFSAVFFGYSMGASPVIGYHYGAGNQDELKSLFKKSMTLIGIMSVLMLVVSEILARPLALLYVSYNEDLLNMTVHGFRYYAISFGLMGFSVFASSLFTALNNGLISGVLSVLRSLVLQVVMVLVLPLILGIDGIWFATAAAEALGIVLSAYFIIRFRNRYHYI